MINKLLKFVLLLLLFSSTLVSKPSYYLNKRHWSSDNYLRIVFYLTESSKYETQKISANKIQLKIINSDAPKFLLEKENYKDIILDQIEAKLNNGNLIIDVGLKKNIETYKVMVFYEPLRLVLDIHTDKSKAYAKEKDKIKALLLSKEKDKPIIVLDAGHGGKDPGTVGNTGLEEKYVTLEVVKKLKELLDRKGLYRTYLTRESDIYIDLEERTAIANSKNADLFISVHVNASSNIKTLGLQTFYLNLATDKASKKLAKRENLITSSTSYVDLIKLDLETTMYGNKSVDLAKIVHNATLMKMNNKYSDIGDLGIRPALFYVLWGAKMPSILIEVGFMSNRTEERRLTSSEYRDFVADCIATGIHDYFK
ncbi:MAG: N-acetylmuramoyl-L-alanine amidase [Pseudomonadota bacterium]